MQGEVERELHRPSHLHSQALLPGRRERRSERAMCAFSAQSRDGTDRERNTRCVYHVAALSASAVYTGSNPLGRVAISPMSKPPPLLPATRTKLGLRRRGPKSPARGSSRYTRPYGHPLGQNAPDTFRPLPTQAQPYGALSNKEPKKRRPTRNQTLRFASQYRSTDSQQHFKRRFRQLRTVAALIRHITRICGRATDSVTHLTRTIVPFQSITS
jgi:hypothetical protein